MSVRNQADDVIVIPGLVGVLQSASVVAYRWAAEDAARACEEIEAVDIDDASALARLQEAWRVARTKVCRVERLAEYVLERAANDVPLLVELDHFDALAQVVEVARQEIRADMKCDKEMEPAAIVSAGQSLGWLDELDYRLDLIREGAEWEDGPAVLGRVTRQLRRVQVTV